jgi:CheY-specific phosphatase CheX
MGQPVSRDAIVDMLHRVTGEVLSTMLNLEAKPEESYTEHQPGKSDGVVSFVGLAANQWAGTGSLHCESDVACILASRFMMSEINHVDDEVMDAFGELTNMIIGNFKTQLETHLGPMALSIPTVVYGKNFSTRSPGHEDWIVVPFVWETNRLNVRLCLKSRPEIPAYPRPADSPIVAARKEIGDWLPAGAHLAATLE